MFVYTNLVLWIAGSLNQLLWLYSLVVIASVVISWVDASPYNPIVRAIYALTEPVFDWVREHVPVIFGGLDLSPLVVLFAIYFLQGYLIPNLARVLVSGFA